MELQLLLAAVEIHRVVFSVKSLLDSDYAVADNVFQLLLQVLSARDSMAYAVPHQALLTLTRTLARYTNRTTVSNVKKLVDGRPRVRSVQNVLICVALRGNLVAYEPPQ